MTDLSQLQSYIDAVLILHHPKKKAHKDYCAECRYPYPCATVRAIDGTVSGAGESGSGI